MEDLLIEMRHEQDVKLKRIISLQEQVDGLTEHVRASRATTRRSPRRKK